MPNVIAKRRQTGKTTQLLYTSSTMGIPILVSDKGKANFIISEAKKLELDIPEPLVISDLAEVKSRNFHIESVLVDEAQEVLDFLLKRMGVKPVALTVRIPEPNRYTNKGD